jgi:hypothetical protein
MWKNSSNDWPPKAGLVSPLLAEPGALAPGGDCATVPCFDLVLTPSPKIQSSNLKRFVKSEEQEQPLVDPLAHIVLGALTEAAMVIAQAEDVESARTEVGTVINRLLTGLKTAKFARRRK